MRFLPLALAAGVLALPAGASAAQTPSYLPIGPALECLQTTGNATPGVPSWNVVSRGLLTLRGDGTYSFSANANPQNSGTGTWSYSGSTLTFGSGTLGTWDVIGDVGRGQRMLHDPVRYRTFVLALRSPDAQKDAAAPPASQTSDPNADSFWNCSLPGFTPRAELISAAAKVKRRTGLKLALPYWMAPGFYDGQTGWSGKLTVQKRGHWRAVFSGKPCPGGSCAVAWLSAHRLRGKERPYRVPRATRLADGIRGYVNTPGCGPGAPSFAVVVCGQPVITWMQRGVEHGIQSSVYDTRDLVGIANQVIRG